MVECANKALKIQVNWREFGGEPKIDRGFVQVSLWAKKRWAYSLERMKN